MAADHEPGREPGPVNKPAKSVAQTVSWSNKIKKTAVKEESAKAPAAARLRSRTALKESVSAVAPFAPPIELPPEAPEATTPEPAPRVRRAPAKKAKTPRAKAAPAQAAEPPRTPDAGPPQAIGAAPNPDADREPRENHAPHAPTGEFDAAAENLAKLVDQGRRVLAAAMSAPDLNETRSELALEIADATRTLGSVAEYWMLQPERTAKAQAALLSGLNDIWSQTLRRFAGEDRPPVVPPDPSDKRFASADWTNNPFFDCLRQSYLLTTQWANDMVEHSEGLDSQTRSKAAFYTRLISSALSPSNFVATNPELLRATLAARGGNLVRGMEMLAEDLSAGGGTLKIRQTDQSKFRLGVEMATTPGKVIFRNEVMELIQYAPTTPEVYARPLLIVPPWINKYYVMDLNREKSFVRWAAAQGLTVFIISWVNPDVSKADLGFEDYMHMGILTALDAIEQATGEKRIAAAGYCVGGTLLASTLAYMAAKRDKRIDSATFFATQVDFSEAGDMQIFVDEAKLAALEETMAKTGYLEGVKMANTFNMLRPNELVWNYVVNNYLKGESPSAFDLLAWNADSTRIPRANHSFYLRNCYLENNLTRGEMVIDGVKLNLKKVTVPIYEIAAREDHIAPARSVFIGAQYFGGPVKFVLGGAGHIAGIINPPDKRKYQYWIGGPPVGAYEDWLKKAHETKGSWWPDWLEWMKSQAPKKVPAREPGSGKLAPVCDAPGEYVQVKA
ncbi:class I poly(R)-hydroxyalkanoic acid synthase [Methylocystis heyeri]|uniref:Class I poly(R)-hydroxyalkanoic acid synthase n=1 Tax=Methylocystis heyeri TaxID=391905 RepID=A0A6B8KH28_9HYPH|nr:class I poly(R)-hydroxyalkanoic acid synthase [Methylocystis heyeri]QGM46909.1 class I poly(R)-hydroxyalkanoic acid synthase [Methylocystis heyeri]